MNTGEAQPGQGSTEEPALLTADTDSLSPRARAAWAASLLAISLILHAGATWAWVSDIPNLAVPRYDRTWLGLVHVPGIMFGALAMVGVALVLKPRALGPHHPLGFAAYFLVTSAVYFVTAYLTIAWFTGHSPFWLLGNAAIPVGGLLIIFSYAGWKQRGWIRQHPSSR